jgi:hypothetical protein
VKRRLAQKRKGHLPQKLATTGNIGVYSSHLTFGASNPETSSHRGLTTSTTTVRPPAIGQVILHSQFCMSSLRWPAPFVPTNTRTARLHSALGRFRWVCRIRNPAQASSNAVKERAIPIAFVSLKVLAPGVLVLREGRLLRTPRWCSARPHSALAEYWPCQSCTRGSGADQCHAQKRRGVQRVSSVPRIVHPCQTAETLPETHFSKCTTCDAGTL